MFSYELFINKYLSIASMYSFFFGMPTDHKKKMNLRV